MSRKSRAKQLLSRQTDANLEDIVRLQLKKPENWKWELSTSKSSPHIPLPIIQLFDNDNKLLVETKGFERKSWHVSHSQNINTDQSKRISAPNSFESLSKSRSDVFTPKYKKNDFNLNIIHENVNNNINGGDKYVLLSSKAGSLLIDKENYQGMKKRRRKKYVHLTTTDTEESDDYNGNRRADKNRSGMSRKKRDIFKKRNNDNAVALSHENPNDVAVTMGANLSRHSSKGLTGRRCQSISNICNSKEHFLESREVDGYKFCNSLPSPNGTACNNNYDHKVLTEQKSLPYAEGVQDSRRSHNECPTLQWKFNETQALYDQGYGSERSPEEEVAADPNAMIVYQVNHETLPFITPENTFEVELQKGWCGLGLSVCGGIDNTDDPLCGLLRIKRLFPHQPAATCGYLKVGDLLLEANGVSLTGLTNYQALDVLRMSGNKVALLVCRPPSEYLESMSPITELPPPPPPPRRDTTSPHTPHGTEFEITLHKIHGSLGFTLCRPDEITVGHYVRALVREPAISDGRIQPGDKIIAVNGEELTDMTHEEAVQFLRQCDTEVILRLSREVQGITPDGSSVDVSPNGSFCNKTKVHLRQEAVDMLSDLAARKLCSDSPCSSPRHHSSHPETYYYEPEKGNQTPLAVRKSKFNLSLAHNAYELNNLDPELLDAPNLNLNENEPQPPLEEPSSMPCCATQSHSGHFNHRKPVYKSVQAPTEKISVIGTSSRDRSARYLVEERECLNNDAQVLNIELNRGWNSRLGFSLKELEGSTVVSAVYPDSVAAKDGRLRQGDVLIKVNDDMVENMKTSDVIDLLRIVRGPVCITVLRRAKND